MKEQAISVKTKDGTEKSGTALVPETLAEAVTVMGEERVYHLALQAYLALCRRRLASGAKPRRRLLKIDLSSLSAEQRTVLQRLGLLAQD